MRRVTPRILPALLIAVGIVLTLAHTPLGEAAVVAGVGLAAIGTIFGLTSWLARWRPTRSTPKIAVPDQSMVPAPQPPRTRSSTRAEGQTSLEGLVDEMLDEARFALLLRPQIRNNLTAKMRARAEAALDDAMAVVPAGRVLLEPCSLESDYLHDEQPQGETVYVDSFFMDRYPVTNRQFQAFVSAGGYQQMAIWDAEILPAVLEFVDSTGTPAPRYWINGRYPAGTDDHPVTGISWYEASAYARWIGRRLPSEAEWVKAGVWPVELPGQKLVQRRYPWGDAMDRRRANIWGSGANQIVPVTEFADGASVGGVNQLVGNIWEWSGQDLVLSYSADGEPAAADALKSIRGGAFDTYFDSHATCQFSSGEHPLSRKHNIGFRCALGACDLVTEDELADSVAADRVDDDLLEDFDAEDGADVIASASLVKADEQYEEAQS